MHSKIIAAAACALAASLCAAQTYPNKPVRVIVGFPPGSGTDMLARFVGGKLTERMGQQIVVDNRAGANGIIGAELVVKAAPDGYTLLFMSVSHTMNAAIRKLPFDPLKSFTPVTMLGAGPLVLVANTALPVNNVRGLIDLAKNKPDTITYAISGTGGINHFAGGLFARIAGVQLVNVPYKGGAQALTDLIGGQVQVMFGTAAITLSQVRAGRLKALGVSSAKRSPLLPEVPTIAESGAPGYEINTWWGVLATAGVAPALIAKLGTEIAAVLNQPESAQRLAADGAVPSPMSGSGFERVLAAEIQKWRRVARETNIRVD